MTNEKKDKKNIQNDDKKESPKPDKRLRHFEAFGDESKTFDLDD